jgi:hypothetical protein
VCVAPPHSGRRVLRDRARFGDDIRASSASACGDRLIVSFTACLLPRGDGMRARQHSGEPLSVISQAGDRSDEPRSSKMDDIEAEITGLPERSPGER